MVRFRKPDWRSAACCRLLPSGWWPGCPQTQLLAWGWRLPFLFSIVLVAIGIWVRMTIAESPAFQKIKDLKHEEKMPLMVAVKNHPKNILLAMGMRYAENGLYYVITVFTLTYTVTALKMERGALLPGMIMSSCDRFGGLPVLRLAFRQSRKAGSISLGRLCLWVLAFPLFWMLDKAPGNIVWGWAAIIIFMQVGHSAMYGPQASFLAELFPAKVRYSGASLGYQLASVFAGGMSLPVSTALLAWAAQQFVAGIAVYNLLLRGHDYGYNPGEETYKKQVY